MREGSIVIYSSDVWEKKNLRSLRVGRDDPPALHFGVLTALPGTATAQRPRSLAEWEGRCVPSASVGNTHAEWGQCISTLFA